MVATLLVERQLLEGEEVIVEGADYRHVFRSRRMGIGDELRVADGEGSIRAARVAEVRRGQAVVVLEGLLETPRVARHVSVFTATPRPERAAWLVEKCTELGVREFVFLGVERTARRLHAAGIARLQRVAKSALLQSGGGWLPKIRSVEQFRTVVSELANREPSESLFVLAPGAQLCLQDAAGRATSNVAVLVGPEGGFVEEEVAALEEVGAVAVGLGPQVLRVETAAVVAAGHLLAR